MTDQQPSRPFAKNLPSYPFGDAQFQQRFEALVRQRLGRDRNPVTIDGGTAMVVGSRASHGLTNLAQVCRRNDPEEWPRIIDEHFRKSEHNEQSGEFLNVLSMDLPSLRDRIGIRIYHEDFLHGGIDAHVLHRVDLEGTVTVPIVDVGPSVMPIPPHLLGEWGASVDMLLQQGIDNLKDLCQAQWQMLPIPVGTGVYLDMLCNDFYAAASVLRAEPFLPRIGRYGNLIALPARELLISWPINKLRSTYAIEAMLAIGNGAFADGPCSITPHLYWRTPEGEFRLQQGTVDSGGIHFVPCSEFHKLMVRLR